MGFQDTAPVNRKSGVCNTIQVLMQHHQCMHQRHKYCKGGSAQTLRTQTSPEASCWACPSSPAYLLLAPAWHRG
jgi:histone acetyltransferase (RNA polymerase elongator complex component)